MRRRSELNKFLTKSLYLVLLSSKIDFAVGGQALIEGVMMRSPNHITIAVRKQDGSILTKNDKFQGLTQRYKKLNIPFVRGVINLFEMMIVGMKALNWSANEFVEEEPTHEIEKSKLRRVLEAISMLFSLGIALVFSLALFKFLPLYTTEFIASQFPIIADPNYYVFYNLIDGSIKTTLFVSYIGLIGLVPSFARVFQYHGAEHKSIWTYEKNQKLEVKNAKKNTRFHPRCGTSFVIIVFAISVFVYSLIPRHEVFILHFLRRIAFLPLIAGIAYEALKISAKNLDRSWVKILITPGLWFQKLTTKEPDNDQLEIGLKSLDEALKLEDKIISS